MHAAIIKLNSLPDSIWATTQNNYFLFIGYLAFVIRAFFKSGIEIRSFSFKLCTAGIYHFVYTPYACSFSFLVHFLFCSVLYYTTNLLITKAIELGFSQ